jgi:hypothetical protein
MVMVATGYSMLNGSSFSNSIPATLSVTRYFN